MSLPPLHELARNLSQLQIHHISTLDHRDWLQNVLRNMPQLSALSLQFVEEVDETESDFVFKQLLDWDSLSLASLTSFRITGYRFVDQTEVDKFLKFLDSNNLRHLAIIHVASCDSDHRVVLHYMSQLSHCERLRGTVESLHLGAHHLALSQLGKMDDGLPRYWTKVKELSIDIPMSGLPPNGTNAALKFLRAFPRVTTLSVAITQIPIAADRFTQKWEIEDIEEQPCKAYLLENLVLLPNLTALSVAVPYHNTEWVNSFNISLFLFANELRSSVDKALTRGGIIGCFLGRSKGTKSIYLPSTDAIPCSVGAETARVGIICGSITWLSRSVYGSGRTYSRATPESEVGSARGGHGEFVAS